MSQESPLSFRPKPAEMADIRLFCEELGLYDNPGAVIHTALAIGFREMKIERGLIQTEKVEMN